MRELRSAVYIAGESLEEALIDKEFTPKMHLVGRWAYLEIVKVVKPEKARSTYYAKDIKVLGNRIIIILLLHISFYIPTFSQ